MTTSTGWELAQLNVGATRGPMDGAVMREFAALLEPVNALADAAPGFVWRLQTEAGDATALRVFGDLLVNMSTWTSVAALTDFVYGDLHRSVLRRRREWFTVLGEPYACCWWVPAGHRPDLAEAEERLAAFRAAGPGPQAFTLAKPQPHPEPAPLGRAAVAP